MISNWFRNCWGDLLVTAFYVLAAVAIVWFLCGLNAGCVKGAMQFDMNVPAEAIKIEAPIQVDAPVNAPVSAPVTGMQAPNIPDDVWGQVGDSIWIIAAALAIGWIAPQPKIAKSLLSKINGKGQ